MLDSLAALLRLRRLTVDDAKRLLAASLRAEEAAQKKAEAAESSIGDEAAAASDLASGDGAVEAFAAWLPVGRSQAVTARAAHEQLRSEVAMARAGLTAARAASDAALGLIERRGGATGGGGGAARAGHPRRDCWSPSVRKPVGPLRDRQVGHVAQVQPAFLGARAVGEDQPHVPQALTMGQVDNTKAAWVDRAIPKPIAPPTRRPGDASINLVDLSVATIDDAEGRIACRIAALRGCRVRGSRARRRRPCGSAELDVVDHAGVDRAALLVVAVLGKRPEGQNGKSHPQAAVLARWHRD